MANKTVLKKHVLEDIGDVNAKDAIFYGDCLEVMDLNIEDNSIDLMYLDPPFNSNRGYNITCKDMQDEDFDFQSQAFTDTWFWDADSEDRVERLKSMGPLEDITKCFRGLYIMIPRSPMLSYLSYMAERLIVMKDKLKSTGSIYLHCDQTSNYYLRIIMDAVFGGSNYRNEIVWCYKSSSTVRNRYPRKHDTIFFYTKSSDAWGFNADSIRVSYKLDKMPQRKNLKHLNRGGSGKWKGQTREVLDDRHNKGKVPEDWWEITFGPNSKERNGYPTQKPLALLDRIIQASSNKGDVVLDPFCGSGTTLEAARKLGRHAIGIDIASGPLNNIASKRVAKTCFNGSFPSVHVLGMPRNMEEAKALVYESPFKFQDWAISLIPNLASNSKKVSDGGIDGWGSFAREPDNMDKTDIFVQVTGAGGSQKGKYQQLESTVRSKGAAMGLLITLNTQHNHADWGHSLQPIKFGKITYRPMQCFSVEEYFERNRTLYNIIDLPDLRDPATGRVIDENENQLNLFEQEAHNG